MWGRREATGSETHMNAVSVNTIAATGKQSSGERCDGKECKA